MRRLYCAKCGEDEKLTATTARLSHAARFPDPAEYERVTWGIAKQPQAAQRVMHVNGEPISLSESQYDCDLCSAPIRPGDRCCAWTVWIAGNSAPREWESEFLEVV